MQRDLGFLGGDDFKDISGVIRHADFEHNWHRRHPIVLNAGSWQRPGTSEPSDDDVLHWFHILVANTRRPWVPKQQLAEEEPSLWNFLSGADCLSYDASIEAKEEWINELERLWPLDFGIRYGGVCYYREGNGDFWQIAPQEFEITLSRPVIRHEGDIEDNNLPKLGDVVDTSFEQLMEELARVATERAWTQPALLLPWYLRRAKPGEPGYGSWSEYKIVTDIIYLEDRETLAEMRDIRLEIEGGSGSRYHEELGRTPILAVDKIVFDVRVESAEH